MAKAMIVYGSTTGNTESVAQSIAKIIADSNIASIMKDVSETQSADFNGDYDLVLMGCSTWGDDEIELQEDFASFFETMDQYDFKGRKMAVFGCGDSSYTHFCGAVDALEEKLEALGADLVATGLKIDGDPDDAEEDIQQWAAVVADQI